VTILDTAHVGMTEDFLVELNAQLDEVLEFNTPSIWNQVSRSAKDSLKKTGDNYNKWYDWGLAHDSPLRSKPKKSPEEILEEKKKKVQQTAAHTPA